MHANDLQMLIFLMLALYEIVAICDLANENGPHGGFWDAWKMSLYNTLWIWSSAGGI